MSNMIDLSGQRFGRLTVLEPTAQRKGNSVVWHCLCDCGQTTNVKASHLRSGSTKSCGCLKRLLKKPPNENKKELPRELLKKYGCRDCVEKRKCIEIFKKKGQIFCKYAAELDPYGDYENYCISTEEWQLSAY